VDADLANAEFDHRCYTTFDIIHDKTGIMWESKKHHTVALSSTETEYMAMVEAVKEVIFIQSFVNKMLGQKESPA
jgi:hypothetical protein